MALPLRGFSPSNMHSSSRKGANVKFQGPRLAHWSCQPLQQRPCLYQRQSSAPHKQMLQRGSCTIVAAANYYSTLGVDSNADKKQIKSAYRQLARKFHPDVNKEAGAEEKFKEISNAYEVLTDDNKRSIYDRYGEDGLKGGLGGMGGFGEAGFQNPFDIFEQFFGGGGGGFGSAGGAGPRNRAQQGSDERADVQLEFNEAVFGVSKELEVSRLETCGTCDGDGQKAGTRATQCTTCGGSGQLVQPVRTPLGNFQQVIQCGDCDGTGERFTPCSVCGGDGRVRKSKRIALNVPPGRKGGPPGDLYVFIRVKKHPNLKRDGTTIHAQVKIPYVDAILGTTVQVPTVDGPVDLKIPTGTQPGTTLLMSKRGVPKLNTRGSGSRGDQQVHVEVTIPTKVGGDEKRLVEELRELTSKTTKSKWF